MCTSLCITFTPRPAPVPARCQCHLFCRVAVYTAGDFLSRSRLISLDSCNAREIDCRTDWQAHLKYIRFPSCEHSAPAGPALELAIRKLFHLEPGALFRRFLFRRTGESFARPRLAVSYAPALHMVQTLHSTILSMREACQPASALAESRVLRSILICVFERRPAVCVQTAAVTRREPHEF